jgi:competence ComEA-like helix-hairpin-helix protein
MFTRNELFMVAFMAVFGIAGLVLNLAKRDREAAATRVVPAAFAVRAIPAPGTQEAEKNKKTLKMECVKININRAGLPEIMKLKGIGPALGARIIECRGRLGGFKSKNDLLQVKGLGPKRLEKIAPLIEI